MAWSSAYGMSVLLVSVLAMIEKDNIRENLIPSRCDMSFLLLIRVVNFLYSSWKRLMTSLTGTVCGLARLSAWPARPHL
jgi:hypothetical protein